MADASEAADPTRGASHEAVPPPVLRSRTPLLPRPASPALPGRRGFLGGLLATAAAAAAGPALATPRPRRGRPGPLPPAPRATRPLLLGTYTSEAGGGTGIGTAAYDTTTGAITPGPRDHRRRQPFLPGPPPPPAPPSTRSPSRTRARSPPYGSRRTERTRCSAAVPPAAPGPPTSPSTPSGRWLLSADYGSGSVAVHPIAEDGSLGERTDLVTHSSPPPGSRPGRAARPPDRHRPPTEAMSSPSTWAPTPCTRTRSTSPPGRSPRSPAPPWPPGSGPPPPGLPPRRALRLPGLRAGQHPGRLRVRPRHRRPHPGARAVHRHGIGHQLPRPAGRHRRRGVRLPRQPGPQQPHPLRRGGRGGRPCGCWTPCLSAATGPGSSPCPRTAPCSSPPTSAPPPSPSSVSAPTAPSPPSATPSRFPVAVCVLPLP